MKHLFTSTVGVLALLTALTLMPSAHAEEDSGKKKLGQTVAWEDNKVTVAIFENKYATVGELWLSHPQQSDGGRKIFIMPQAGVETAKNLARAIKKAHDMETARGSGEGNMVGTFTTDEFKVSFYGDIAQTTPVVKIQLSPKDGSENPSQYYFLNLPNALDLIKIISRVPGEVGMSKREEDIQLELRGLDSIFNSESL